MSRPLKSYCLYVWGAQIPIFRVFGHILTISTIGFLFWGFIRGNRPEMSINYAIFKICPKFARKWYSCETSVYSIVFGDSWWRKVVSVFKFGRPKSNFFAPQITKIVRFQVQKNGTLGAQIRKRRPLFVANYSQKWWNRHLLHMNIIFRRALANFENRVI